MSSQQSKPTVGIIGAGLAGITCANKLLSNGFKVTVFEKSRGLGGRLSTRRIDESLSADHGAQFFTARSAEFIVYLDKSTRKGAVAAWSPKIAEQAAKPATDLTTGLTTKQTTEHWYVGVPAMNSAIKASIGELEVMRNTRIIEVTKHNNQWQLTTGTDSYRVDTLVCTAPAPQAFELLHRQEPSLVEALKTVKIAPCWSMMVVFEQPLNVDFDVWRSAQSDISWAARNTSKPAREENRECWVIHASPAWSRENLEVAEEEVIGKLLESFQSIVGGLVGRLLPSIAEVYAHRWRFAKTEKPLGQPYLKNSQGNLYLGGDWCLGARVECAFQSGFEIAQDIAKDVSVDR